MNPSALPDGSGVAIVPLRDDLIDEVISCAHEVWHAAYDALLPAGQVDYMLARRATPAVLSSYLTATDAWFDVAVAAGDARRRVVGYSSTHLRTGTTLRLEQLYAAPDRWGSGLADDLLAVVTARARSRGATNVDLTVNKGNARALAYYRRRGFRPSGTVVTDIGGGFVMDDLVLTLPLSQNEPDD